MGLARYDLDCGGICVGHTSIVSLYWALCEKGAEILGCFPCPLLLYLCGLDDLALLNTRNHQNDSTAHIVIS